MKIFILFLILISTVCYSNENGKIEISGGMKYIDWPANNDSVLCRIDLKAPKTVGRNRDPFLFIFLMDFWSTRELGRIIDSPSDKVGLVNNISDGDYIGAISYSKNGKIISPLKEASDAVRKQTKSSIRNVKTVEGINLEEGLQKLEEMLNEIGDIDNSGKFVFLITDNYSDNTTFEKNLATIKRLSEEKGINFSTFGHYKGFNEDFLIETSFKTGGRSFYFDNNKIYDLEKQITEEIERIKNSSVIDISLALDIPDNIELVPMMGLKYVEDEILLDRLSAGSKNSLFFFLKNRPQKRRDIVVDLNYLDAEGVADQNEVFYFDIPVMNDKKIFNTKHAPSIIIYETKLKLWMMSNKLIGNNKENRQIISDTLDNRILILKEHNNFLDSPMLQEAIEYFTDFKDDVKNSAIDNEIIVKKIKYKLLEFVYGK